MSRRPSTRQTRPTTLNDTEGDPIQPRRLIGLRPSLSLAAAAIVLTSIVLASCGGEGDGTAPAPLTPEAAIPFGPGADSLCAAAQAEQEAIRRGIGGDQITLDDRARLLVELAPSRVALGEELRALEPPVGAGTAGPAADLAAAAERRGVASTRAGELWERGASEQRIAVAAAAEHDERERFVAIATRLGLVDCAEVLSAADRRELAETVELGLASPLAGQRCASLGERYLRELFGDLAGCLDAERGAAPAESVTVGETQGIGGVFALARVTSVGGSAPGEARIRLVYEAGRYRIDKID